MSVPSDSGLIPLFAGPDPRISRSARSINSPTVEELGAGISAGKCGFGHTAIPDSKRLSTQTQRFHESALSGDPDDIRALAEWACVHETENEQLRQRFRKQQHTFASLMEMVNAAASRALDINSLQNYMLRTVSGQFTAPRVLILRRTNSSADFTSSAAQGMPLPNLRIHPDATICLHALSAGSSFSLKLLPESVAVAPEIDDLVALGLEIAVPLMQEADHMGVVLEGFMFIGPKLTTKPYTRVDIEFLDVLARLFAISLRNENLYRRSIIDALTGVASRGHFDAQLTQELNRISAYSGQHLSLIMLDVDHFKKVNDTHGHQAGDLVLQGLSKTLQNGVRSEDLVARYGGEEFAIILSQTPQNVAIEVAERLLAAVAAMEVTTAAGVKLRVTASFGIASFPENAQTAHGLIQLADAALYRSKDLGRNRITVSELNLVERPKDDSGVTKIAS